MEGVGEVKICQKIKTFFIRRTCAHKWIQLKWHGLPGEPDLMRCIKCDWITKFEDLLPEYFVTNLKAKENGDE